MEIKKFEDFLLEKKDKQTSTETWGPGKGEWYLDYTSQLAAKDKIRITKKIIEDLLKDITNIDNTLDSEKIYRFFKYFFGGEDKEVPSTQKESWESIRDTEVPEVNGKPIKKWLDKITNEELSDNSIVEGIYKAINDKRKDEDLFNYIGNFRQIADGQKNIFSYKSSLEEDQEKIEIKKEGDKILNDKTLPIGTETAKGIYGILTQCELCISYSRSCLVQIDNLSIVSDKETGNKLKDILDPKKEGGIGEKIEKIKLTLKGIFEEEKGSASIFNKTYSGLLEKYNSSKDEEEKNKIKEEISKLITDSNSKGFTLSNYNDIKSRFSELKDIIKNAKEIADDGEITKEEWIENVKNYTKDENKIKVKSGEGLRASMYGQVKEAFSLLQSAIDNYSTGENEKNAIDQYLSFVDGIVLESVIAWEKFTKTEEKK
jgi:hypothetical protein